MEVLSGIDVRTVLTLAAGVVLRVRVLQDLLLDDDMLLLEGDVLLASVCICLHGCSSVRLKSTWKCPPGIRVHEFAPKRSGELVNVVGAA